MRNCVCRRRDVKKGIVLSYKFLSCFCNSKCKTNFNFICLLHLNLSCHSTNLHYTRWQLFLSAPTQNTVGLFGIRWTQRCQQLCCVHFAKECSRSNRHSFRLRILQGIAADYLPQITCIPVVSCVLYIFVLACRLNNCDELFQELKTCFVSYFKYVYQCSHWGDHHNCWDSMPKRHYQRHLKTEYHEVTQNCYRTELLTVLIYNQKV